MRIQHNIPAMNAYRNYNTNVKSLQGNLQKLSSGYKINKAGDDAAGLAISEKMRAQITGLEVAQKNAKDGISLVQTAEGALQEVHTMLNRMYSLAEQSANGTYEDDVDREQLQKEVTSLKEEIDRIADSTNFNGKKLLDGSLDGGGKASASSLTVSNAADSLQPKTANATKGKYTVGALTGTVKDGDIVELNVTVKDASGKEENVSLQMKVNGTKLQTVDGKTDLKTIASGTALAAGEVADAAVALIGADKDLAKKFDGLSVSKDTSNNLVFDAKEAGASTPQITAISLANTTNAQVMSSSLKVEAGADEFQTLDLKTNAVLWKGDPSDLEDAIFEINGKKFVWIDQSVTSLTDTMNKALNDAGVGNNYVTTAATNTVAAADITKMAAVIARETGLETTQGQLSGTNDWTDAAAIPGTNDVLIGFKKVTEAGSAGGNSGGLNLQIGDTSDDYNRMIVSVKDCHAAAIGVNDVDISTEDGASAAMKSIKSAINYVSDVRGTLGSLQNRLDHTINNLSVQQENIQDAEATIRDVDVANEMMAYTKNNILVQSAQAMLAQANQLPQGVLQLLG